jgi:hypothetical protein
VFHRHLTLERYELALEEGGPAAEAMRRQAERCPACAAALAQAPLAPRLAAWPAPESAGEPVDWEAALRRAIAPARQRPERRRFGVARLAAATGVLAGLLLVTALPAAASAGPDSVLYPVRGAEENVRWRLTPQSERAGLETELVSSYLWQARTSAARHDDRGYDAAMARFFTWADRLRTDIHSASPDQRSTSRSALTADRSLVTPLTTSGPDPAQALRAQSMMDDVQSEAGDDGHRGSGGSGSGGGGDDQHGGQGSPTAQPTSGEDGGQRQGGSTPAPTATSGSGRDGGHDGPGGS